MLYPVLCLTDSKAILNIVDTEPFGYNYNAIPLSLEINPLEVLINNLEVFLQQYQDGFDDGFAEGYNNGYEEGNQNLLKN